MFGFNQLAHLEVLAAVADTLALRMEHVQRVGFFNLNSFEKVVVNTENVV